MRLITELEASLSEAEEMRKALLKAGPKAVLETWKAQVVEHRLEVPGAREAMKPRKRRCGGSDE